jgi:hypothetical protein
MVSTLGGGGRAGADDSDAIVSLGMRHIDETTR